MKIRVIPYGAGRMPKREHYNDAGADVFSPCDYNIAPGGIANIPLGFGVEIPDGYMGFIIVRSSMAARGLDCMLPPIDSGYIGEIHAIVHNTTNHMVAIKAGNKVGQLIIVPVVLADFVTSLGKERGSGAFGSTGQ